MKPIFMLAAVLLLGIASLCPAGTIVQKKGPATLEVTFDGATPKLALSDVIGVTLTVEGPKALRAPVAPLELPGAAPWVLVERSKLIKENVGPDRIRYRLTYRFGPREPGKKVTFQFPEVKVQSGDDEQALTWKPVDFEVETQIAAADRKELRDITSIEALPPFAPPDRTWVWLAALAVAVVLGGVMVLGVRRLLRRTPARTPAQIALYEWQRLMALDLPGQGRSERFITLLTTLVRRFLERQLALPARRQTTPEFVRLVETSTALSAEQKQFLIGFLSSCDAVKFGRQPLTPAECARWASSARAFLESYQT
jgi:hypothetical protein